MNSEEESYGQPAKKIMEASSLTAVKESPSTYKEITSESGNEEETEIDGRTEDITFQRLNIEAESSKFGRNDEADTSGHGESGDGDEEKQSIEFPFAELAKPSTERRRTIYELDSYVASNISIFEDYQIGETIATVEGQLDEPRQFRYSEAAGMPGIARINLSPLTQKIVGCVIGENVTTEYPWIYVKKEIIEDNLDLHAGSSDFLAVRDHVTAFPDKTMLIGYSPSSSDEGQFYICLTEAGRDAVVRNMENLRLEQEDKVRNAVYKTAAKWQELGSASEVAATIVTNSRPLFEIEAFARQKFISRVSCLLRQYDELSDDPMFKLHWWFIRKVESTSDLLNLPIRLIDRSVVDQRDGYVELLPYRQTFRNVTKRLVSKSLQTGLTVRDNEAQTAPRMLVNSWFQYRYDYEPINTNAYNEEERDALKRFLDKYSVDMYAKVMINSTWDIYADDCKHLVRDVRDTRAPVPIAYTEHQSFYDGKLTAERVINDLCWHPFWTGIAVAAYTEHCKSQFVVGPTLDDHERMKWHESGNQVLIWSFNDCLTPKLILECPRQVTTVSICPLDGSVIVGGCASGQIVIWSIPDKIEQVEAVVVSTTAQVKYRIAMRSLMSWMKITSDSSVIQHAALSSLQTCQKGPITQILWFPAYNKIDKNGKIESLPGDTPLSELSQQFATSSQDGTVAFWDLRWDPREDKETARMTGTHRGEKSKKSVKRPEALVQSISQYKSLDGLFHPFYMLSVNHPDDERPVAITTMSIYNPKFDKKLIKDHESQENDDVSVRKYYKMAELKKPDYELEPQIFIGTVEGHFGCLTWNGYDFTTGLVVNRELVKWDWANGVHDGPVTHSVRSKYLRNVVLTIGGKVFAVWRDDFGEPVISRNCNVRYTACCWGTFRPTVVILGRADGTAEIWDFIVKTHEPSFTQGLSGRIITGIYPHELYLHPQCIAFCDYNGTLRVFTAPPNLLIYEASDIEWMRKFVDREVDRIRQLKRWEKSWNETNVENIKEREREAELEVDKKKHEADEKIKNEMAELLMEEERAKKMKNTRKPGEFLEAARNQWKDMELERMKRVILEKKGLRAEILENRRAPYLKLRQEAKKKKQKIREIMQLQDKIFQETMAFLFPEQYRNERAMSVLPEIPSFDDESSHSLTNILHQETKTTSSSPQEQIMYEFMEIQSAVMADLKANPYRPHYDWRKVLRKGEHRRQSLDIELKRERRNGRKPRKTVKIQEFTLESLGN